MSWHLLAGVVEWWSDERPADVGRRRFHGAEASIAEADEGELASSLDIARAAFVAQRDPRRLAELPLATPYSPAFAAAVAWADDATAVLEGDPPKQRVVRPNEAWGDLGVSRLLWPHALSRVVARPWSDRLEVPGDRLEKDLTLLPELVTLAADRYEAQYDPSLDVLTTWTSFIEDRIARRIMLTELVPLRETRGAAGEDSD